MFFLFEDKARLLDAEDEVTNTLVDRVARHIDQPLWFHFSIEQLGMTWKEVSGMYHNILIDNYYQQVRCEGNTE